LIEGSTIDPVSSLPRAQLDGLGLSERLRLPRLLVRNGGRAWAHAAGTRRQNEDFL